MSFSFSRPCFYITFECELLSPFVNTLRCRVQRIFGGFSEGYEHIFYVVLFNFVSMIISEGYCYSFDRFL